MWHEQQQQEEEELCEKIPTSYPVVYRTILIEKSNWKT